MILSGVDAAALDTETHTELIYANRKSPIHMPDPREVTIFWRSHEFCDIVLLVGGQRVFAWQPEMD